MGWMTWMDEDGWDVSRGAIWLGQWHPTPVLLPGISHGWRSPVGCSPWGCKESDMTEQLHFTSVLSRWCLLGLDCPIWFLHTLTWLTVSWCWLFGGSSLGLSTSAYTCPLHLTWASHSMVAGSESNYSKRHTKAEAARLLMTQSWKSHSIGHTSHYAIPDSKGGEK